MGYFDDILGEEKAPGAFDDILTAAPEKSFGQTVVERGRQGLESQGVGLSVWTGRSPETIASDIKDTVVPQSASEIQFREGLKQRVDAFDQNKSIGAALDIAAWLAKNPKQTAGEVAQSLGMSAPAMTGAAAGAAAGAFVPVVGPVVGGIVGYLLGNLATNTQAEIAQTVEQRLAEKGVDIKNVDAVTTALKTEPSILEGATQRGLIRGGATTAAESVVDLVTLGIGKALKPATSTAQRLGRIGAAAVGQGVGEGAGSIAADVATGDPVQYGQAITEGLIGVVSDAPVGVAGLAIGQRMRPADTPPADTPPNPIDDATKVLSAPTVDGAIEESQRAISAAIMAAADRPSDTNRMTDDVLLRARDNAVVEVEAAGRQIELDQQAMMETLIEARKSAVTDESVKAIDARMSELAAQQQATREADAPAILEGARQQNVEQALARPVEGEPTAMQLALQKARENVRQPVDAAVGRDAPQLPVDGGGRQGTVDAGPVGGVGRAVVDNALGETNGSTAARSTVAGRDGGSTSQGDAASVRTAADSTSWQQVGTDSPVSRKLAESVTPGTPVRGLDGEGVVVKSLAPIPKGMARIQWASGKTQVRSLSGLEVKKSPSRVDALQAAQKDVEIEEVTNFPLVVAPTKGKRMASRQEADLVNRLAQTFGKKVVFFKQKSGQHFNGAVLAGDDSTIYINTEATDAHHLVVAGHEIGHLMRRDAPDLYTALQKRLAASLTEGNLANFSRYYNPGETEAQTYARLRDSKQLDNLTEEFIVDLIGNRAGEYKTWTSMMSSAKGEPNLIQRVGKFLIDFIDSLLKRTEFRKFATDKMVKDLDRARSDIRKTMAEYAKRQAPSPAKDLQAAVAKVKAPQKVEQAVDVPVEVTASTQRGEPDGLQERQRQERQVAPRMRGPERKATPTTGEGSFQSDQRVGVIVGGKPGEFDWDFTRVDLPVPPFQAPTQYGPRLERIGPQIEKIFAGRGFAGLIKDAFGITGLEVTPIHGSWKGKPEPSFLLSGEGMTFDQANELSKMVGFAFAQEATIVTQPVSQESPGEIPALYIGKNSRLTQEELQQIIAAARDAGVDYSSTADGRAVKFLHFGDESEFAELASKVAVIQQKVGLPNSGQYSARSSVNEAAQYLTGSSGSDRGQVWLQEVAAGSPDLFGRTVDHLLVPYAKAVGSEGYRFAVQRFSDKFGLSESQRDLIRDRLIPRSGVSKSTVAIASKAEVLEVNPTSKRGSKLRVSVSDILWALQNRSAKAGLIEPGDYSNRVKKVVSEAIADEVIYHINQPKEGKSAIGWYDAALKDAKQDYRAVFPEIATNSDKAMLFDALWGITSQGNDVFSNSQFGARVYQLLRDGKTMPEAVKILKGTFGGETVAIENNLIKFDELINRNGYPAMRRFFNTKGTVASINAKLRKDESLFFKGKPLQAEGQADQIISGWMVFGPKIGSFINNLHGDYSTLTADLWFSRSWNRILGYSFVHTPALEAVQYQNFMRALTAEAAQSNPDFVGPRNPDSGSTDPNLAGPVKPGTLPALDPKRVEDALADPYVALELATELEEAFRKGGYKVKSELRRAAKNWVENRETSVAAPRTDLERAFQQKTAEAVQGIVKRKTGKDITIADVQAALWFYEKDDLFGPLGGTNKKSEGADYAGAAKELLKIYRGGDLFHNKTDDVYVYGTKGDYLNSQEAPVTRSTARQSKDVTIRDFDEYGNPSLTKSMSRDQALRELRINESQLKKLLACMS